MERHVNKTSYTKCAIILDETLSLFHVLYRHFFDPGLEISVLSQRKYGKAGYIQFCNHLLYNNLHCFQILFFPSLSLSLEYLQDANFSACNTSPQPLRTKINQTALNLHEPGTHNTKNT